MNYFQRVNNINRILAKYHDADPNFREACEFVKVNHLDKYYLNVEHGVNKNAETKIKIKIKERALRPVYQQAKNLIWTAKRTRRILVGKY